MVFNVRLLGIEGDTTFLMMESAQARGHSLFVYVTDTLAMDEGRVTASGRDVTVQRPILELIFSKRSRIFSSTTFDSAW